MRVMRQGLWGLVWLLWAGAVQAAEGALEGGVNPGYHEPPSWFKASFLDLGEDVAEAAAQDKGLLLYFYQDGCPYCAKLLEDNFGQRAIAEKARRHYDVLAINIWGDREVTALDGTVQSEKQFAVALGVMYTPTLLFLDDKGQARLRLNGYYPPHKFEVALDYGRLAEQISFRDYLAARMPVAASGKLHSEPFFLSPPYQLARQRLAAERPLAVLFEQKQCAACDELHREVLNRPGTRELLERFDVVQLDMWAPTPLVGPAGQRTTARQWAADLGVSYAPTWVFFDQRGKEVFRAEAYLRAFHLQSVLEYVASGAYREQPNFQRFVQSRADRLEAEGVHIDLME